MTRAFAAVGIDEAVADLRGSATSPAITGLAADLGSWCLRANGSLEGEIFQKLGASNTAWGRNNLTLKVFNVKNFGAVGDGVTNDTAAITAAITACKAARAGTIYFPPGQYGITKPAGTGSSASQTFLIENCQDINFVGDGQVSLIKMIGSANFSDWRAFTVRNFAARINFYNLGFDASTVTNPDPSEQLHFIQFQGLGAQPVASGATDCEVIGCWFGRTVGDGVRTGGEATKEVSNIRVRNNVFMMTDSRSCVGMQRFSNRMDIGCNFMTGVSDQEIDYEPTGGGGNRNDVVIGNICAHNSEATASITLGGAGGVTPIVDTLLAYNIIDKGGYILPSSITGLALVGNIIESVDDTNPALYIRSLATQLDIRANVLVTPNAITSKVPVLIARDADGDPVDIVMTDNVIHASLGNACIITDGTNRIVLNGNTWYLTPDVAGTAVNVGLHSGATNVLDQVQIIGDLAFNESAGLACFRYGTSSTGCDTTSFVGNMGVNPGASCYRWEQAAAAPFGGVRACMHNVAIGGSSSSFDLPATNVGASFAGSAGKGVQQDAISLAAGPEGQVTAPVGSTCANYLGGNATTLFYKDTGVSSSGWLALGGWDYAWGAKDAGSATTALFMAPGLGLATAGATELKVALARDCRIRNLRIRQDPGTGAGTVTYTVRINGVDTVLTATINFTATTGANTTNSRACSAGDQISIKATKTLAPATNPTNVIIIVEII